jgi:biotin operon repressor
MTLSDTARRVLDALIWLADGSAIVTASYDQLQAETGLSRTSVASGIAQLRAAGTIAQRKGFGESSVYKLTAGRSHSSPTTVQCNASDADENSCTEKSSAAANADAVVGLLDADYWLDFEARVGRLLDEWLIRGHKRRTLAAAIVALAKARSLERDKILADLRAIREGAVQRATTNATGLTIHIVQEYLETGQIALFDVQPQRVDRRGRTWRLPQVEYTPEQHAAAEKRAEAYLAKKRAETPPTVEIATLRAQLPTWDARKTDYARDYAAHLRQRIAALEAEQASEVTLEAR